MRRRVATVLCMVLVIVAVGGGVYVFRESHGHETDVTVVEVARDTMALERDEVHVGIEGDTWAPDVDENLLRRIDFDSMLGVAPDATRWFCVPGTALDAPVMQEHVVGEWYYDLRDMYGQPNNCGSFVTPALREGTTDGHLIILGHCMNSWYGEWQFSMLSTRWGSIEGAQEYPFLYLYYPDHSERWRVWAGAVVDAGDTLYDLGNALGSDGYDALLEHMSQVCRYMTEARPDRWTPTLMLSTCERLSSGDLGRFALMYVPDLSYDYGSDEVVDRVSEHADSMWRRGHLEAESPDVVDDALSEATVKEVADGEQQED